MRSRNRANPSNSMLNFFSQLSTACSELCLIIFLFFTSTLSNLASKFAKYCGLQTPCFICSQLYRKSWFGGDSICDAHKLEISSLSYCERHNNLGFAQDLCQRCHLSCSNLIKETSNMFESEKGDCSCCFRKRSNAQNASKGKEKVSEITEKPFESKNLIDLEEVGYREVKTISDSESESKPKSNNQFPNSKNQSLSTGISDSRNTSGSNVVPAKVINVSPIVKSNPLSEVSSSKARTVHGLDEINWNQVSTSCTSTNTTNPSCTIRQESPKPKDTEQVGDSDSILVTPPLEVSKWLSNSDPKRHISITRVLSTRAPVQSPRPSEIISSKENLTTQEEIQNLFSQITPTPRVGPRPPSAFFDESVNSKGLSVSIERNSSSLDSFEVNMVSDIEGETDVEKLRCQVEMDRQNMRILYKELEEERNASAIAASEAMAMINRLQEEKAGIKMESLQYLRLMEEGEEYDKEAIKNLEDLLNEREKELLDLEAEIEEFKRDFLKFEKGLVLGFEERGFVMERLRWLEERVQMENWENLGVGMENGELKKEVRRLNERFERIEMDQRFISHALGAIKEKGDEGIKFVEEIAGHLRELRKINVKNQ
ncbi:hypothetical protein LUZ60_005886 [Juncus effusus]|nr:hypothetical protein LUZ60_005886 [Juncus effusus]